MSWLVGAVPHLQGCTPQETHSQSQRLKVTPTEAREKPGVPHLPATPFLHACVKTTRKEREFSQKVLHRFLLQANAETQPSVRRSNFYMFCQ